MRRRPGLVGSLGACLTVLLGILAGTPLARADEVRVAVAANFAEAAREIGRLFEEETGHQAVFSVGSTGQLYAQITQDAPFDVFLAADQARPERAVEEGHAVPGSLFTYALGRLVLFSREPGLVTGPEVLGSAHTARIAIANPETAPYGAAAIETMRRLGVLDSLQSRLVRGNNIAQAFQFVETGNAGIGFVALSQLAGHEGGSRWPVPDDLHAPIAQDAVLLVKGSDNPAAAAFLGFLAGETARTVMARLGYGVVD